MARDARLNGGSALPRSSAWPALNLDEFASGTSAWPTIWCAMSQPWYPLANVAARLGFLPASTALLFALGFYTYGLSASFTMTSEQPDSTVRVGIAGDTFVTLALVVAAFFLRRAVRNRLGIDGSTTRDVCMSLPGPMCISLAAMERASAAAHLSVITGDAKAPETASSARAWVRPLFWITAEDVPFCYCAGWCSCFGQLRICVRLGGRSRGTLLAIGVALAALDFLLGLATGLASTETSDAVVAGLVFLALLCGVLRVVVTIVLRTRVRAKFNIAGSLESDALVGCCCAPCALSQMEAQTTTALQHDTAQQMQHSASKSEAPLAEPRSDAYTPGVLTAANQQPHILSSLRAPLTLNTGVVSMTQSPAGYGSQFQNLTSDGAASWDTVAVSAPITVASNASVSNSTVYAAMATVEASDVTSKHI